MPKVKPAFRDILIPLTAEEVAQLEENIKADGRIREAIILWKDWILDGHHRVEIAERLGLNYQVQIRDFPNESAARDWIIRNQLGRRNITEAKAKYLRGLLLNSTPAQPGKRTDAAATSGQIGQRLKGEKAAEIAEKAGVSEHTVRRDGVFAQAVNKLTDPLKAKALDGKLTQAEVKELAKKTKTEQSAIAREARTEEKSFAEVLGIRTAKKEKSPAKPPPKTPPKQLDRSAWFRQWETSIGPLVRLVDKIAAGVGESKCESHKTVQEHLEIATQEMMAWLEVKK